MAKTMTAAEAIASEMLIVEREYADASWEPECDAIRSAAAAKTETLVRVANAIGLDGVAMAQRATYIVANEPRVVR